MAREGRVVAIRRATSAGQQVEVEDDDARPWLVDCLGEPLQEGARIRFEPLRGGGAARGVCVRVLESGREAWVCTLRRFRRELRLVPFGGLELPPLVLAPGSRAEAVEGDRVVVTRAAESGRARRSGRARKSVRRGGSASGQSMAVQILENLGPAGDPEADFLALVWKYDLPRQFSRRARLEVAALPDELPAGELARRLDLRALPFVTIDPASARDHDDALYAEPRPRAQTEGSSESPRSGEATGAAGWVERLWVAIADVAHFVAAGGFVDAEARRRANSFYFPDRALPMLPERLSSELCSLRPGVDRLVLAVELRISSAGEVVDARFHEAVIRSHAKLSYEEAAARLASEASAASDLGRLARIAERLGAHRRAAGAIELELPEVEIEVDDRGRPVDARLRVRNPAHALVEEAMLAANRAVATALEAAGVATLHRVHPPPDARRLEALAALLERLGVEVGPGLGEPGGIASMLRATAALPGRERIHLATLRSLGQARYEPESRGHHALQFSHYLHFTSPIRRYADLAVHRALRELLWTPAAERNGAGSRLLARSELERLAIWLSGRERVAIDAERESAAFACCALLAGREGETFLAAVTGVGEHGLFVRLDRPAASGLVPLRSLLSWQFDAAADALVSGRGPNRRRIEVGERLRVRLARIDPDRGRLAFALVADGAGSERRGRRSQSAASDSESASHSR